MAESNAVVKSRAVASSECGRRASKSELLRRLSQSTDVVRVLAERLANAGAVPDLDLLRLLSQEGLANKVADLIIRSLFTPFGQVGACDRCWFLSRELTSYGEVKRGLIVTIAALLGSRRGAGHEVENFVLFVAHRPVSVQAEVNAILGKHRYYYSGSLRLSGLANMWELLRLGLEYMPGANRSDRPGVYHTAPGVKGLPQKACFVAPETVFEFDGKKCVLCLRNLNGPKVLLDCIPVDEELGGSALKHTFFLVSDR